MKVYGLVMGGYNIPTMKLAMNMALFAGMALNLQHSPTHYDDILTKCNHADFLFPVIEMVIIVL